MTSRIFKGALALNAVAVVTACGADRPFLNFSTLKRAHGKHAHFFRPEDDPIDTGTTPEAGNTIAPRFAVTPYTQWNANNGYCGELSSIQAGMGSGQWMSQFNARSICGTGLSQSGHGNFCSENGDASYNAQFLFENPNPGDNPFASAPVCLANAQLAFQSFDYAHQPDGIAGYQKFMSWVKARVIAGDTVAVGVLNRGGDDPQYDHEVTVTRIGTNHAPSDAGYYEDDILYFEDHSRGGSAYTRGFTFASLAKSRDDANGPGAGEYSILIPGGVPVLSGTGGDGINLNPHPINPTDYAFAVAGPRDQDHVTLPVTVSLIGSSVGGVPHPPRTGVNFNFEAPGIGEEVNAWCTNAAPTWMDVTLQASIGGLTPGTEYNVYEYDLPAVSGEHNEPALRVPERDFNASAAMATKKTTFVADAATHTETVTSTSDKVVVVRCVSADAP